MRIGELSNTTGVSVRSLRYYEEQGLLGAQRTMSGQRTYTPDAVERVELIQQLFTAGLSSAAMVDLLPCISEPSTRTPFLLERLRQERSRIDVTIDGLARTRRALDNVIDDLDAAMSGG